MWVGGLAWVGELPAAADACHTPYTQLHVLHASAYIMIRVRR